MSKVVRLPKLIAWHQPIAEQVEPGWMDTAITLGAILCPPGLTLRRDDFLGLLGNRIQHLVNACEDPHEITDALVEDLFEAGLYPRCRARSSRGCGRVSRVEQPGHEAAPRLVGSATDPEAGPTCEMTAAREALSGER